MPNSYDVTRDPLSGVAAGSALVARDLAAVTPNDAADLALYARALRVHVPATVSEASLRVTPLRAADDAATITLRFASGTWFEPVAVRRVWATGTTAGVDVHAVTA